MQHRLLMVAAATLIAGSAWAQYKVVGPDGKITYNAAGTLSRGIMAYRPGWKVGFRRQVEPYLYRAPDGESWQMTLTARLDLQTSQQTKVAAMLYNSLA